MKTSLKFVIVFLALLNVSSAHAKSVGSPLDRLQFLIGDWKATEGILSREIFSFALDLQKRVIVQKTHGENPPVLGHPAYAVDGLMIIYPDPVKKKVRADYFDSNGNVLHYTVEVSSDDEAVTFISETTAIGIRFRTTYFKRNDDALGIKALMAHPGSDEFHLMDEGVLYKK
jgi:hypothetical protein